MAAYGDAVLGAEGLEMPQEVETRDHGRQGMSDQRGGILRIDATEDDDLAPDAGFSQAGAFLHGGDPEMADPFLGQDTGALDVPVTVRVRFHHGEDFHVGAYQATHRGYVGAQGGKVDAAKGPCVFA